MKLIFVSLFIILPFIGTAQIEESEFLFKDKIPSLNGPVQKRISYNCTRDSSGLKKTDTLSIVEFSNKKLPLKYFEFRGAKISTEILFYFTDTVLTSSVRKTPGYQEFFSYFYHANGL